MKKLFLLTAFILIAKVSFGQLTFLPNDISKAKDDLPENIKKITQYQGDYLLNVREYDKNFNQIFSHYKQYVSEHWNDKYLTMIKANVYDEKGLVVRSYHLHSNAGHSIYYHEYDSLGNNTKIFKKDNAYEKDDELINKNPYAYIAEIKTFQNLINHPKIKEIEATSERQLILEMLYDTSGNLVEQLFFDAQGDTSMVQKYQYDENHNTIYHYSETKGQTGIWWEYYYEYEKEEDSLAEKKDRLLQSVRVDFDRRENRPRVSAITIYRYDDKDRLKAEIDYSDGKFESKYVYEHNNNEQVIKRLAYLYDEDNLVSQEIYEYNPEGDVVKHIDEDYRTDERKVKEYRYTYEYYE